MSIRNLIIAGLAGLTLGGCVTTPSASGTINERNCEIGIGGWCKSTIDVAKKSWKYAQMANNAYELDKDEVPREDDDHYVLPGNIELRFQKPNDGRGFAYTIYDRYQDNHLAEVIIAYRGTEPAADDFIFGNLLGGHNARGRKLASIVDGQIQQYQQDYAKSYGKEHPKIELSVTGHSLGGGIAHYTSYKNLERDKSKPKRTVDRSYVFNHSPWYSRGKVDVPRLAVLERGDPLAILRFIIRDSRQQRQMLNCWTDLGLGRDHGINRLADCLTWIAALGGDEEAIESLLVHDYIEKPDGQISDVYPVGIDPGARRRPLTVACAKEVANRCTQQGSGAKALYDAILESVRNSKKFDLRSESRAGLVLELLMAPVQPDGTSDIGRGNSGTPWRVQTRWLRNKEEIRKWEVQCLPGQITGCAADIVAQGDDAFPSRRRDD